MEWLVYWSIEPPLAERIEIAIAILSSLTANIHRDDKKQLDPFAPKDFIFDWQARLEEPADVKEDEDETPPGLAPEHVMGVMEGLLRHQERRLKSAG